MPQLAERNWMLWLLAASPSVWLLHLLACYITAAVWCGRIVGPQGPFLTARLAIGAYTIVALVAIGVVGAIGFRRHRLGSATLPHDDDTPEDRHRFLGFSTFLLSGLSAVGVIYSAIAALIIETCE